MTTDSSAQRLIIQLILLFILNTELISISGAASLEFHPDVIHLAEGETVFVEVLVKDIDKNGLSAFQFDLHYDPDVIQIIDPNKKFAGSVSAYVPLGDNPFCQVIRETEECTDNPWMLIQTERSPIAKIREEEGRVSILYGTSGNKKAPSGSGVIALLQITGIGTGSVSLAFSNAILANNSHPPSEYSTTLNALNVQVGPSH